MPDAVTIPPVSPAAQPVQAATGTGASAPGGRGDCWQSFAVEQPADAARAALGVVAQRASRKGMLPGYGPSHDGTMEACRFHAFGEPFDHEVRAVVTSTPEGHARVDFVARVLPKTPAIFLLISVLSVWPGAWLTDSMLKAYFPSYTWNTYLWYLPLTVLPLPWMGWRMWTRSRSAAREHAGEKIAMLRELLEKGAQAGGGT